MKKTRYFKPRKDLEYSDVLLPHKVSPKDQEVYKYGSSYGAPPTWHYRGRLDLHTEELLKQNFIEVTTEQEAIN